MKVRVISSTLRVRALLPLIIALILADVYLSEKLHGYLQAKSDSYALFGPEPDSGFVSMHKRGRLKSLQTKVTMLQAEQRLSDFYLKHQPNFQLILEGIENRKFTQKTFQILKSQINEIKDFRLTSNPIGLKGMKLQLFYPDILNSELVLRKLPDETDFEYHNALTLDNKEDFEQLPIMERHVFSMTVVPECARNFIGGIQDKKPCITPLGGEYDGFMILLHPIKGKTKKSILFVGFEYCLKYGHGDCYR